MPPDTYFPRVREICDKYGLLLIMDEVITGFGRTGRLFGCEHWDVEPISSPSPKDSPAAISRWEHVWQTMPSLKNFSVSRRKPRVRTGLHLRRTPRCMCSRTANLEILTGEGLTENAERVGGYLLKNLKTLERLPIIGDVRGEGADDRFELVKDADGTQLDTATTKAICAEMLKRGSLSDGSGRLWTSLKISSSLGPPPLILTAAEADRIFETLQDVLTNL